MTFNRKRNMIANEMEYRQALATMDALMEKYKDGENSEADAELLRLAQEIDAYETRLNLTITKPLTLGEIVLDAMHNRAISLAELAEKTGLDAEHLNAMIQGKAPFSLDAVKRLYFALHLDAQTVLEHA
jgi:antitoxin component HigA of HigAB toxin-antitoxin module